MRFLWIIFKGNKLFGFQGLKIRLIDLIDAQIKAIRPREQAKHCIVDIEPRTAKHGARADAFDARLRILLEDVEGRRWTAPVLVIPSDDWLALELGVASFVPAEAPASRSRPDGAAIRRIEIRDVTAFHAADRGENRLFFDDVDLR